MGKYKMPDVRYFLKKRRQYDPKKEPVWIYLEREMLEKANEKPYNNVVGNWLKYLKDLRYHFFCEGKRKYRRLHREAGPAWYYEFSESQIRILAGMKVAIHEDLLEDIPIRVKTALQNLGITLKFPVRMLLKSMEESFGDPGVFVWILYSKFYKSSPNELLPKYDINAMLLMSALVFIDLEECIQELFKITRRMERPPPRERKPKQLFFQPDVRLGEYLQKTIVTCYSNHPLHPTKKKTPMPLVYKIKLRNASSYENLAKRIDFLEKRKERNRREKQSERVCHYKFWEPPSSFRTTDPKMAAYYIKLKMFKKKARARFMKYKPPYENIQCHIGTVSYTGGIPRFVLNNFITLPSGYIIYNGGVVKFGNEYVTQILGFYKYPKNIEDKCECECDCTKWEPRVIDYIKDSKCKCGHRYDLYHQGKPTERYFYAPKNGRPFWFDQAKIYQMDPWEDFVKDTVKDTLKSESTIPSSTHPTISPWGLKPHQLLSAFFADLNDTPLIIPHLPNANRLNNLGEWVRKRIKGDVTPKMEKQLMLRSQRRWLDLKHMDFRERSYMISFTQKQKNKMDFSHRPMIQSLANTLLRSFEYKNRKKQLEQTRLWWPTMYNDVYPSKAFRETFFTYMPGRIKDTFVINPYNESFVTPGGGKTCSLEK